MPPAPAPPRLPEASSRTRAREMVAAELGLSDETPRRVVTTPSGGVLLDRNRAAHITDDHYNEHREQFANRLLPTLTDPDEVWLAQYDTGPRLHYIKAWDDRKFGFIVATEDPKHGRLLWTFLARERVGSRRVGQVVFRRE